jgi:hypothetical protein
MNFECPRACSTAADSIWYDLVVVGLFSSSLSSHYFLVVILQKPVSQHAQSCAMKIRWTSLSSAAHIQGHGDERARGMNTEVECSIETTLLNVHSLCHILKGIIAGFGLLFRCCCLSLGVTSSAFASSRHALNHNHNNHTDIQHIIDSTHHHGPETSTEESCPASGRRPLKVSEW